MFKIRKGEKMENEFITSFEVADGKSITMKSTNSRH